MSEQPEDLVYAELQKWGLPSNQRAAVHDRAMALAGEFDVPVESSVVLALQTKQPVIIAAAGIQGGRFADVANVLKSWHTAFEVAKVWGQYDLLARLEVTLFELQSVQRALLAHSSSYSRQNLYYLERWDQLRVGNGQEEQGMIAWVVIKAPLSSTTSLRDQLRADEFPEVKEFGAVFGEQDFIVKVEVPDNEALSKLVYERIQRIAGCDSTLTYICVDGTYWKRT